MRYCTGASVVHSRISTMESDHRLLGDETLSNLDLGVGTDRSGVEPPSGSVSNGPGDVPVRWVRPRLVPILHISSALVQSEKEMKRLTFENPAPLFWYAVGSVLVTILAACWYGPPLYGLNHD